jgi:hypothetical protein
MKLKALLLVLIATQGLMMEAQAQNLVGLFALEEGARPAAMGGAFVGLAEGGHTLYYNPAGLAFLRELHVGGLFESRFARASYGTITFALPNVGSQLLFLNVGGITQRDEQGIPLGDFGYSQLGFLAGAGLALSEDPLDLDLPLAVGLQLKLYRVNTLPEGSGAAFSLTPSLLWVQERFALAGLPVRALRLGLIAPNLLGLGITYGSGHHEGWATGLRLGAALLLPAGLTFATDLDVLAGSFHLGGEWTLSGLEMDTFGLAELGFRLGLRNIGEIITPSVGFGLRVSDFRVDYAFVMHPELAGVHRIEFAALFGPPNVLLCAIRPEVCPPDDPIN